MAGATWNCCHLGALCVPHTTMHHVTSCKANWVNSNRQIVLPGIRHSTAWSLAVASPTKESGTDQLCSHNMSGVGTLLQPPLPKSQGQKTSSVHTISVVWEPHYSLHYQSVRDRRPALFTQYQWCGNLTTASSTKVSGTEDQLCSHNTSGVGTLLQPPLPKSQG